MKPRDLTCEAPDSFDRPLCRSKDTGLYYCVLEEGITFDDILAGRAELYYKGTREGEPEYPVTLEPDLVIFTQPNCPWCTEVKALATRLGYWYTTIDIKERKDLQPWFKAQGHKTVPQVYAGAQHIGGYEAFETWAPTQGKR